MTHLIILPILLPLLCGAWLLLDHRASIGRQRLLSLTSVVMLVILGVWGLQATLQDVLIYWLGNWAPPFGIVLQMDRFSALMTLLTAVVALACVLYAGRGHDRAGSHFHALFQFQLMGVNGAFLTGDLFNLFVFFEVLLLASYALLLHGGGRARSRAGLHYVVINLVGSALFLLALGVLYGVAGTLNMADLAVKIGAAGEAERVLLQGAALLLLSVFGIKAALLPMLFWLPRAYSAAAAPVAALFSIMTKVGFYAMVRVLLLVFGLDVDRPASALVLFWLGPLGLLTAALGAVGILGAASLRTLTAYLVILSSGLLFAAFAFQDVDVLAAALFYLLHSTGLAAALFLLSDLVGQQRGQAYDRLSVTAPVAHAGLLGSLYLVAGVSVAGVPPLSGFISKALLLRASAGLPGAGVFWTVILMSGLLLLAALSRAGSRWFWKPQEQVENPGRLIPLAPLQVAVVGGLLVGSLALTIWAEPVLVYLQHTARQLYTPAVLVRAVLGSGGL